MYVAASLTRSSELLVGKYKMRCVKTGQRQEWCTGKN